MRNAECCKEPDSAGEKRPLCSREAIGTMEFTVHTNTEIPLLILAEKKPETTSFPTSSPYSKFDMTEQYFVALLLLWCILMMNSEPKQNCHSFGKEVFVWRMCMM